MNTWMKNNKATIEAKEYLVLGFRLYNTDYYGEYGEYEHRSKKALDEWMLDVMSWDDGYGWDKGHKVAGDRSEKKMWIRFHDKDEANKCWKYLKDNEPDWKTLQSIGFEYYV